MTEAKPLRRPARNFNTALCTIRCHEIEIEIEIDRIYPRQIGSTAMLNLILD